MRAEIAEPALERDIEQGARGMNVRLEPAMLRKLTAFVVLLEKWNRVFNLTSIRETNIIVSRHLLDSLAVAKYLPSNPGIDIGTGAGFPGIPIAIVEPARTITLLDSSQKRTAFLRQVSGELNLHNVDVVCDRAELWRPAKVYGWAISRAFGSLADFVAAAWHLVTPGGVLLAMKGHYPQDEIAQLPGHCHLREVVPLTVPGLGAARHLVVLERT